MQVVGSLGLNCITKVNYIDALVFTTIIPIILAVLIWIKYIGGEDGATVVKWETAYPKTGEARRSRALRRVKMPIYCIRRDLLSIPKPTFPI